MMNLFDYQQKALDSIVNAFKRKATVLAVMATGLGKTIVSAFWVQKEINSGHKGLFLCHNNGILDQAMLEFRKVLGEQVILKPFYGSSRDFNADQANVVFASFQTYRNWKHVFFEDEFDFIIVDESHHGQAPSYKEVILYFKPKKLLGITATPDRMDLKNIREIFGKEVVNYSLEESIAKGWLTQVEYHILNDRLSHWKLKKIIRDVLKRGRRISLKQLNETIFVEKRDDEIARMIQQYAGTDKKVVIFCEAIEHVENFKFFLPNALTYHSRVEGGEKENRRRLSTFREDSQQYILAVNKFNEGIDVPDVEVIVFLRCTDSRTIFYQQLGRGLRKVLGKSKVVVLDFVANCERLAMVKEMAGRVKELAGNNFVLDKRILHVSGKAFDFVFSDDQIDILNVIKRINEPFYKTWQEASRAAVQINAKTERDYQKRYKIDPSLVYDPGQFYVDFPGWYVFLRKNKREYYLTLGEASKAVIGLGIKNYMGYRKKHNQDPKLPPKPECKYKDFPGWKIFLEINERKFYVTCQEASEAAKKLGISTTTEYKKKRKQDRRLPDYTSLLYKRYKDFPGWARFIGKKTYPIWREAGNAAISIGIQSRRAYQKKYKQDPKLPSDPRRYKNFPGWKKFLGKGKKVK